LSERRFPGFQGYHEFVLVRFAIFLNAIFMRLVLFSFVFRSFLSNAAVGHLTFVLGHLHV